MSDWGAIGVAAIFLVYGLAKVYYLVLSYYQNKKDRQEFNDQFGTKEEADEIYNQGMKKTIKGLVYFVSIITLPFILIAAYLIAGSA